LYLVRYASNSIELVNKNKRIELMKSMLENSKQTTYSTTRSIKLHVGEGSSISNIVVNGASDLTINGKKYKPETAKIINDDGTIINIKNDNGSISVDVSKK